MLTIKIKTGNAAFHDDEGDFRPGPEIARILQRLAFTLRDGAQAGDSGILREINGSRVGEWRLTNR